jgi:hypothetical protein
MLSKDVFAGTITFSDAIELWWIYIRAWIAIITRVGFLWVVRNGLCVYTGLALVVFVTKYTSLWPGLSSWLVYWGAPTTYRSILEDFFETFWSVTKGFALLGGVSTMLFSVLIMRLIWMGIA